MGARLERPGKHGGFTYNICAELEDVVHIPNDKAPTLSMLDSALRRFISLAASYHGEPDVPLILHQAKHDYTRRTILAKPLPT